MTAEQPATPPVVEVVSGRPDPGELAAVVAVLLASAGTQQGAGGGGAGPTRGAWGAPSTMVRPVAVPGAHRWGTPVR